MKQSVCASLWYFLKNKEFLHFRRNSNADKGDEIERWQVKKRKQNKKVS